MDLSLSQFCGIIAGDVENWAALGYPAARIRLLRHGGLVNRSVLDTCLAETFGLDTVAADTQEYRSYEELARAGAKTEGSLVLGLRPTYSCNGLRAVKLSGVHLVFLGTSTIFPAVKVWLLVTQDSYRASILREVGKAFDVMSNRIRDDMRYLQTEFVAGDKARSATTSLKKERSPALA